MGPIWYKVGPIEAPGRGAKTWKHVELRGDRVNWGRGLVCIRMV